MLKTPDVIDDQGEEQISTPTFEPAFTKLDPAELNKLYELEQPFSDLRRRYEEQGSGALSDTEYMDVMGGRGKVVGPLERHVDELGDKLYDLCRCINICTDLDYHGVAVCPRCMQGDEGKYILDEDDDYGSPATMEYDDEQESLTCENCGLKMSRVDWEDLFPTYGTDYGMQHVNNFMYNWLLARKNSGMDSIPLKIMAIHYMINAVHGSGPMASMFFSGKTGEIRRKLDELSAGNRVQWAGIVSEMVRTSAKMDEIGQPDLADRMDRLASPIMDLYHGTRSQDVEPEDLEPNMPPYEGGIGRGVYFGLKPETAEYFGPRVIQRQMDIQNPLVIDAWEGLNYRIPPEIDEQMEQSGAYDSILVGEQVPPFDVLIGGEWYPIRDGWDLQDIGGMAAEAGHDAVILRGVRGGWTGYGNEEVLVLPHHPAFQEPREASVRTAKRKSHFEVLKDHRVELDPEERKKVMDADAVWHHGPGGKPSPAVWKAVVDGKTTFVCNTHRAFQERKSLDDAIKIFHSFIKGTA